MQIDKKVPAGNIKVISVIEQIVSLEKEMRDTEGNWFYWKFRACFSKEDAGKTFTFRFENGPAMGECGPAFSTDRGGTWRWLGIDAIFRDPVDGFRYRSDDGDEEVWFCMGIPYLESDLNLFLDSHPDFEKLTLCRTKKGREVELLKLQGGEKKLFLTSRHHACEMMATYVLEGILDYAYECEEFRKRYAVYAVPFIDKDGAQDGDQGKYRLPHDHNRDYWDKPVYPETKAVMALLDELRPDAVIDLHCPWLHDVGNPNGTSCLIHYLESEDARLSDAQRRFGERLEKNAFPLKYTNKDMLPFGSAWNNNEGETEDKGEMFDRWAQKVLPDADLVLTVEIPYAKVYDTPILADDARKLGHAFGKALKQS